MSTETRKSIPDLLAVMAALRTPKTGCPWDLAQDFRSIAPYTIEEAYEVVDAIERQNMADLEDELGDLLLQVVYHSRMAEEQQAFAFADVADAITRKMIRRHPHVFGTAEERAAGAAPGFWEKAKAAEKATAVKADTSILDGVPLGLPGLTRAIKLQDKAAKVGFDWPSLTPVFDKLREEFNELEEVIAGGDGDKAMVEEELGDLLFVVANVARHLKVDPEAALRNANQKFSRRFNSIERSLAVQGRTASQSTLAEMDQLWDEAKAAEKRVAEK
jgi:nucleoside triphosphate diphosphatase